MVLNHRQLISIILETHATIYHRLKTSLKLVNKEPVKYVYFFNLKLLESIEAENKLNSEINEIKLSNRFDLHYILNKIRIIDFRSE